MAHGHARGRYEPREIGAYVQGHVAVKVPPMRNWKLRDVRPALMAQSWPHELWLQLLLP